MTVRRFGPLSFLVVVGGLAIGTNAALAAPAAGCFVGPARLSDDAISSFLSAPESLLASNPNGGVGLASSARELAGSSADALPSLQSLVSKANASQKSAIGAGLARAARACQRSAPDYAQQIQALVAGSQSPELVAAFVGAQSEIQTAAIGGGAAGGGAGGGAAGGIGNSGSGAGTSGGGTDTPSLTSNSGQGTSFSSGRSVSGASGDSTTTTIISVSPTT